MTFRVPHCDTLDDSESCILVCKGEIFNFERTNGKCRVFTF